MPTPRAILATVGLILLVVTPLTAEEGVNLQIDANRRQIYQGESIQLYVRVSGMSSPPTPDLSGIANAEVNLLDSRIVNVRIPGTSFFGRVFTYQVTPSKTGEFVTGPVTIRIGDKTLTAVGPSITVSEVEQQDLVRIRVDSSREAVLVEEPFDIRLVILVRALGAQYAETDPIDPSDIPKLEIPFLDEASTPALEGPNLREILQKMLAPRQNQPGFAINNYTVRSDPFQDMFDFDKVFEPRMARFVIPRAPTLIDGKRFWEYSIRLSYRPKQEGNHTFGPVLFKGKVVQEVDTGNRIVGRPVFTIGPAVTVRVIPPPEEGRPDSFIGSIGSNVTVQAALDTQVCKIGDPLTLTLSVNGNLTIQNVNPPPLNAQPLLAKNFRIYDDTVRITRRADGVDFAYTIRPTTAGTMELPPVNIAYYDASQRRYRIASTTPIPLQVKEAIQLQNTISAATNATFADAPIGNPGEILIAPMIMTAQGPVSANISLRPWHLAMLGGWPAAFAMALGLRWMARARIHNLKIYRRRSAAARARSALHRLHSDRSTASSGPAPNRFCHALREYIAWRFDMPETGLTPADARLILCRQNVTPALVDRFQALMEKSFNAAYATGAASQSHIRPEDLEEADSLLTAIETELRGAR